MNFCATSWASSGRREGLHRGLLAARLELGELEQVGHQPAQALALGERDAQMLRLGVHDVGARRLALAEGQRFQVSVQHCEGRAQIV